MPDKDLFFVIPTYRLRDVGETVELYDEHFWRNGHSVKMIVFDDSSPVAQEKYYPLLEQARTHNDLFYVGPMEILPKSPGLRREIAMPPLPLTPFGNNALYFV